MALNKVITITTCVMVFYNEIAMSVTTNIMLHCKIQKLMQVAF